MLSWLCSGKIRSLHVGHVPLEDHVADISRPIRPRATSKIGVFYDFDDDKEFYFWLSINAAGLYSSCFFGERSCLGI